MRRRKGYVSIILFATVLIGLGISIYMMGMPRMLENTVEQNVKESIAITQSRTAQDFIETHYDEDAMNWSSYQTSYRLGNTLGPGIKHWNPGSVAQQDAMISFWQDEAASDFYRNYMSNRDIPQNCELQTHGFIYHVSNPHRNGTNNRDPWDIQGMNISAGPDDPPHITCQKGKGVFQTYFAPNVTDFTPRNRFFYLFNAAAHLANDTGFRRDIAKTASNSSRYAAAMTEEVYVGECTSSDCAELTSRGVKNPDWNDVADTLESAQAQKAEDDLDDELNSFADRLAAGLGGNLSAEYNEISIDVTIVDIDYEVQSVTKQADHDPNAEGDGWRVSSCEESCDADDSANIDSSCSCDGGSGSCSCDADECQYPNFGCSEGDWDDLPQSSGDIWTENPWDIWDVSSSTVAASYLPEIPGGVAYKPGIMPPSRGNTVFVHSGQGIPPHCHENGCPDIESRDNNVNQQARTIWHIDSLESEVTVRVTVTDDRYTIPTNEGLEPLTFRAQFTQESSASFDEDDLTGVTFEKGTHEWMVS